MFPPDQFSGKIIIIGNSAVGKTTLSMCQLKKNTTNIKSTQVAAAFFKYSSIVEKNTINLEVWDTAGQEQYQSMVHCVSPDTFPSDYHYLIDLGSDGIQFSLEPARSFYRNVDCALIIFDVTSRASFNNIRYWVESIESELNGKAAIVLVANKVDVEQRTVSRSEGLAKSKELQCDYVETSGLVGINVSNLFDLAAKTVMKKKLSGETNEISIKKRKFRIRKCSDVRAVILFNQASVSDNTPCKNKCF